MPKRSVKEARDFRREQKKKGSLRGENGAMKGCHATKSGKMKQ